MLRLALPSKGRLANPSTDLLEQAGFHLDTTQDRKLTATSAEEDLRAIFARAGDIPEFVADDVADAGITGLDLVRETGADVEVLLELGFGRCRLMVAKPESREWTGPKGLEDGVRVATSFPNLTREWFADQGVDVEIVAVGGSTEVTPHLGVADLVTDLVSTGSTMAANSLEPVETILESEAVLVGNRAKLEDDLDGERLDELAWVLESVLEAKGNRYLMANVPRSEIDTVREMLPGLSSPTVLDLLDRDEMVAVHAVVPEADVFGLVRALKDLGASGILVTPIERLVP
jgi:ATP phosphoribosyltransferase